jgi:hypothetical protein
MRGLTVAYYWVYFFGADNHISHARDIECEGDAEAVARVREMERVHAVEVWTGGRLIQRLEPGDAAAD